MSIETATTTVDANVEQVIEAASTPVAEQGEPVQVEQTEQATFDADYVKSLRAEAAEYRVKAKRAEALAAQALAALAAADGRLIDPSDLHYDESLTNKDGTLDPDKVTEAIGELIRSKPHLMKQRPTTPVAQGPRPAPTEPNLLQLIKGA